jgi:DNA topoisomerase-1
LYLDALVSYPRTDSQRLPPAIGYENILKNLSRAAEYRELASKLLRQQTLKPNEGKRVDPAHPAIFPTGNLPQRMLETSERKIWDLFTLREEKYWKKDGCITTNPTLDSKKSFCPQLKKEKLPNSGE